MAVYSNYFIALNSKLLTSVAITAALTPPAVIADHIISRRFRVGDPGDDKHVTDLQLGPMIYMIPSSCDYVPMTEQHGKGEAVVELDIHSQYINGNTASMIAHIKLVDDVCVELMAGSDGTGGHTSWMNPLGGNLRISSSQVEQLHSTELRTKVRVRVMLLPVV